MFIVSLISVGSYNSKGKIDISDQSILNYFFHVVEGDKNIEKQKYLRYSVLAPAWPLLEVALKTLIKNVFL